MGNSEVGHLNLGRGPDGAAGPAAHRPRAPRRLVLREPGAPRGDGARRSSPGAALHLMGLLSDGGVHSHERHLFGLLDAGARRHGVPRVVVHAFTDGRDTPPRSALAVRREPRGRARARGGGEIAHGLRPLLRHGPRQALGPRGARLRGARLGRGRARRERARRPSRTAYARGETDEFILPTVIDEPGRPVAPIARRRRRRLLQFPGRPGEAADAGADRAGFAEFDRGRSAVCFISSASREYKKEFALARRLPAARPRADPGRGLGRAAASRTCAWRRPRSTRT